MSTSLCWQPITPNRGKSLSAELKFAVSRRFFAHDGSLGSEPVRIGAEEIPFLEGIEASGHPNAARDARILIDAIEKFGAIEIWTES